MTAFPRSVRARLVATYTVVAVALAAAGITVFAVLLNRGLTASLDAALSARLAPVEASVRSSPAAPPLAGTPAVDHDRAPAAPGGGDGDRRSGVAVDSFTAVYRPDGLVSQIQPSDLRYSPLSRSQLAAAQAGTLHLDLELGDDDIRTLAVPVAGPGGTWVVAAGNNVDVVTAAAGRATHDLLLAVPFLILAAALGAWLLSGAALRPVERLRAEAARLGANHPESRLSVPETADELARLAETFNGLLDRLQRSVARQRDLVADAGHELRTPLAVLRTELDLAGRPGRDREYLADSVAHARDEVDRLSRLADDLLFLANADGSAPLVQPQPTDLSEVVAGAARAARAAADQRGIDLRTDLPPELPAAVDAAAIRRVVDNLVSNALAATPAGGTVTLAAGGEGETATIRVCDTGSGFPAEFLPRAFQRFTRADGSRTAGTGGSGLGLAIVDEIVRAHGGAVRAANRPGGGAEVTVDLPGSLVDAGPHHLHMSERAG